MLYLVKLYADQQALGGGDKRIEIGAGDAAQARLWKAEGRLMGLWRRADCGGAVFVIDAESHEALASDLQALPLFPYLRNIEVTPLLAHPAFPECSKS
ncbi:hypothetical protein CAF53_19515 [Sphingobium sp. LB126]|uniref:muconolactone Delta-isomerase family protein n=1 Tax=Sphingobium sp. LB126 TaxID=1983755 RepID=UPI000C20A8CA|nr:muconolactone Delta-isomerase family protein [Sphingobium sp. LB126]PJG46374.1 hypothetical protein CAF53_19515 [Sphingobium sp. LB126]